MTWTVHTCLITLAILCVWQAEVAETCSCFRSHPQEQFCSADIVIKAKVLGKLKSGITKNGNLKWYKIKQHKLFKGECIKINTIYTGLSSASCGITLKHNTEYLLSGSIRNGRMHVNLCNLVSPWNKLTDRVRQGVVSQYELGCGCKIMHCFSPPCATSSSADCLWGDAATEKTLFGKSTKGYTCVMKSDKSCAWCKAGKKHCINGINATTMPL